MSNSRNQTFDTALEMKDAGLVAASAPAQVDAAAKVIDVGALTVGWNAPMGPNNRIGPSFSANLQVDVSAIEVASDDEIYDIVVQGSNTAAFADDTDIVDLCQISLGSAGGKRSDCNRADTTGRYIQPFHNIHAGVCYRYLRVYTIVGGTVATGINYTARLGVMSQV